ncbi:Fic family protein [Candidatus Woesebacteria bacterium]|nr:Fic family protein [Candidatus Woesebacteria bacterium]
MNDIIPHKLIGLPPSKINYVSLMNKIGEVRGVLGELKGRLAHMHIKPNLLSTPLLTKEAVLSSRIEGTQATIAQVLEYEAKENKSQTTTEEVGYKEVVNYRIAVEYAKKYLERKPIGENLIRETHRILMDSVRGASKNPGNFRRTQVAIGTYGRPAEQATYFPPLHSEIPALMSNWEHYMHSYEEKDILIKIGVGHYQFEAVHPFMDGNGRIGRLLIPLFLCQYNILPYPVVYISEYFEENRQDYYNLLNNVTKESAWESWLDFFFVAIIDTSSKTLKTINAIDELYNSLKESITGVNSMYAINLLDAIFESPIVSFSTLKDRVNARSPQTIYNLLKKFVKEGLLREGLEQRNKLYIFDKLLRILG